MESVLAAALLGSLLLPLPQRAPPASTTRRHAPVVAREWKPGQGFGAAEEQLEVWVDEDDTNDAAIGLTAEEMDGKRDRLLEKWADFVQLGGVKEQQAPVLVELRDVRVSYGGRDVVANASWAVREGQVVGVLGESGCGKSTQLRLLAGELTPHEGEVKRSDGLRVGYVPQGAEATLKGSTLTVRQFAHALGGAEPEPAGAESAGAESAGSESAGAESTGAESAGAESLEAREARTLRALAGASLPDSTLLEQRVGTLSNGQRARLATLAALAASPQLLLLDEPTNHLDLAGLEWLEQALLGATADGEARVAAVVVSHDREFLDRVTTHTLDAAAGRPRLYLGGYTAYAERKAQRDEALAQQTEEARSAGREVAPEARLAPSRFRIEQQRKGGKGGKARAADREQVVLQLAGVEVRRAAEGVEGVAAGAGSTEAEAEEAAAAAVVEEAAVAVAGERPVLRGVDLTLQRGQRLLLLGDNGAGKSTLLLAALGRLPLAAGSAALAPGVSTFYFAQDAPELLQALPSGTVLEAALAEAPHAEAAQVTRALKQMGLPREMHGTPARALSGGERARFCLAQMLLSRAELLVLDEPTNHLDLTARLAVEEALRSFEGTLLLVSHDRYFAAQVTSQVAELRDGQLRIQRGDYRDYVRDNKPLEERLTRRVVPGASQPLLDGPKPRLRLPGGKVLVDGREMDAKQAKGRKRKWRGAAGT